MKKKLLLPFLALNAVVSAYETSDKHNKMYNNIIKNIEQGKSNQKNYQIIEEILKKRNKELKDLYSQGDYIIKPEYLEWQIFFSGFYEKHNKAGNSAEKSYKAEQNAKEIDLGISIPVNRPEKFPVSFGVIKPAMPSVNIVTPIVPNISGISPVLPTITSFDVPVINPPTPPTGVTITAPKYTSVTAGNFNAVEPAINPPSVFSPVSLNFSASGFHQSNIVGVNTIMPPDWTPAHYVILNNSSAVSDTNGTKITINNNNYEIENKFTWSGVNDSISLNGIYGQTGVITTPTSPGGGGTGNIGNAYRYAFANIVASSVTLTGDWEFVNNVTNPALGLGLGNSTGIGITRFAAISHGFGARDQNIEFILNGTLKVRGSNSGHITIVFENQYYDLLPSKITNNATVTIEDGKRVFVVSLMNEGGRKCDKLYWGGNAADTCRGATITKVPLKESTYINNGKIIMKNTESIGIDFGSYYNIGTPLFVYIEPGEMELLGNNSYAIRVPNIFSTYKDYFKEAVINGTRDVISLEGERNIGISLIRRITGSVETATFNGFTNSSTTDPIGNIKNLRFLLNGEQNIGILRDANYATQDILLGSSDIILNDSNVQELKFGNESNNSTLIRTDRAKIILNKNLVLDAVINNTKGNNIVMIANDSAANNGNALYKSRVENNGSITFEKDLFKTTGLVAINGGIAVNNGNINIKSLESNGLVIFSGSTGENKGMVTLDGKGTLGVYNTGNFTMSSGIIAPKAEDSIGVYATNTTNTNITGGNIKAELGGIALYSGDNATINLSGTNILTADSGGLLFYSYETGGTYTGKYNIAPGTTASVEQGGLAMFMKVSNISDIGTKFSNLKGAFLNPSNLTIDMAEGSSILYIDGATGPADITGLHAAGLAPGGMSGFFNFTGTGYNEYVIKGLDVNVGTDSSLDSAAAGLPGTYKNIQFLQSSVKVAPSVTISGTQSEQAGIVQKNSAGGTVGSINIENNGTISLSGNKSTGAAGDYVTIRNKGTGKIILGTDSVGMYAANGSLAINEGEIELNAGSVGIYGRNYFDGITDHTVLGYGTDKIDIENQKDIKTVSGGVTGNATGIYADNILTSGDAAVNLTSTSNIDLKGTNTVIGVYLKKTDLTSAGTIKVESAGTSAGIFGDESTAASITGSIDVSGGSGTGIYLKNSDMSSGAAIKVDNVTSGIGIYVEATAGHTSAGINTNTISLGDNVTGMYSLGAAAGNEGTITNTGTIQSLSTSADKAIGMYIGSNGTGNNSGNIYLTAVGTNADQVGIYNSGIFHMTGGNIEVFSENGAGLYTTNTANLSGGIIKTGAGSINLYADNSTINLSGTYKSVVENGGIFALNNGTGKLDVTGNIAVDIEAGGMAFSSTGALNTYLASLVSGTGTLEINLKDPASKLAILDSPGTLTLSSIGTAYTPGSIIAGTNVRISSSSNPNYTLFSIMKGRLLVDQSVNLNNTTDPYNKSDFINSSVDINSSITGSNTGQLGVGQKNYASGIISNITINNNSIIDLSGNDSTGILADFGIITNTAGSSIKVTGEGSVGIYAANGTTVTNSGTINIGNKSVGIYGTNYLDGVTSSSMLGYGNDTVNITNNGNIISTGTTHGGYGIYVDNITGNTGDSIITLGSSSNIDVSGTEQGIGIYSVNSTLNIDGNISVGKNGIGVYAGGSTGTIHGGTINLTGDNAIGYYLTNATNLTNSAGSIYIDGKNIAIMITDAGSNINLTNPFVINSTPGSTYTVGNMIGGDFYNNTNAILGSNGVLINGAGTVALLDSGSNITSAGTNVSAMILNGQNSGIPGYTVSGSGGQTVNEEGTNLGIISLGNSSAGIYLAGGARGRNEGTVEVKNNSVGMYGEGSGSYIVNNNGIVNIGMKSTGIFLKNGQKVENTGTSEIKSTDDGAVGIHSENTSAGLNTIINTASIKLSGNHSTGVYTTGGNNITNSGLINIGNSLSQSESGVGIYADNINSTINNTTLGQIIAGDDSIGIYNINGNIINDGKITAGNGGTGIYSDGGTINLNTGSVITVGQNDGVGVYALNQAGTVINNSAISIGDGSYGFVFTGSTTPAFINNEPAVLGNNSVFVYSDSALTADNNETLTMTGSDNIGYYFKNGGSFINNANITGNTGVSNIGVYAKGANIVNNADIILGDSNLAENTASNGIKYKTGYSIGIYGEDSNITNNSGRTIQVGKEGIGIYVKGAGYTAENYGIINGAGNDSKGIVASDYAVVKNYGTINMAGDNVTGIVGQNGAQIYNDYGATINVTGDNVTGIYLAGSDTKLINNGEINITGTGLGIAYTPNIEQSNMTDTTGATKGSTSKQYDLPDMPTLVNTGVINVNVGENFNYDGIRVIIKIDPITNMPATNSSRQIGFGGTIPGRIEVTPDFAVGILSDRYIFENIFKGTTGKGEYISQSLTWDATAKGSDLVMTRKSYTDFTDGLWFEDFGREMNEKYAVTSGEGRKIFDKINYITNEADFQHTMASLAGNMYANMNQREATVIDVFDTSLNLLQDSKNNTKENVKVNVMAGKGKLTENTDGVSGYNYESTGILALREVERTYKHTFGYSAGYLHTDYEMNDGNSSEEDADTLQLGLHNKYNSNNWVLRNDLLGRVSFHNTDRNIDWTNTGRSELDGTYETYSISSNNKLGKELSLGKNVSITPYGGLDVTYMTRPAFSESGLEALEVKENDAWSVKPKAGMELKGEMALGEKSQWKLKGALDIFYGYELGDLNEREYARLVNVETNYHKLSKPEEEKGILSTKAVIGAEIEDRYGIFLTGEYKAGNDKQNDYRAGLTLKAVF